MSGNTRDGHGIEHLGNDANRRAAIKRDFAKKIGPKAANRIFNEGGALPESTDDQKLALMHITSLLQLLREPESEELTLTRPIGSSEPTRDRETSLSLEEFVKKFALITTDRELPIEGDGEAYIDYIFGKGMTEKLSLKVDDIPSIITAMAEINEGFGQSVQSPQELIAVISLRLQGLSHKEASHQLRLPRSEVRPRSEAFRTRTVRIARQKGYGEDKLQAVLETQVDAGRPQSDEVQFQTVDYEIVGNLTSGMRKFFAENVGEDIANQLLSSDAVALTEAVAAVNGGWHASSNVTMRKAVLFGTLVGFEAKEIAEMKGITQRQVEDYLRKIRVSTKNVSSDDQKGVIETVGAYVRLFRQEPSFEMQAKKDNADVYTLDRSPHRFIDHDTLRKRIKVPVVRKAPVVKAPNPLSMPPKMETDGPASAHFKDGDFDESESLFEQYRKSTKNHEYAVDDDCPEISTAWGLKTLSMLYDTFTEGNTASIIRERADGTDKSRRPNSEVTEALNRLVRIKKRAKVEFDDGRKATSFDMLVTPAENGGFNTLGDIGRQLKSEYPELQDTDVAEFLVGSIRDVLQENAKVLVVGHR